MGDENTQSKRNITDDIGDINTAVGGAVQEGLKKLDEIPKVGKSVLGVPAKVVDGVLLTNKVAIAPTEKEKFTEVYKWSVGTAGSGVATMFAPLCGYAALACAGLFAYGGSKGGEWLAEQTADIAYPFYKGIQKVSQSFFGNSSDSDSSPYTPSNTILTTLDTSQPLLHLNVFLEDSFIPVHNATIRLVPFRTMIANKTQDSIQEQIIQNGKVSFNLPSNAEKFEFFILDTRFLEKAKGDT